MKLYMKALAVALVATIVFISLFSYWRAKTEPVESARNLDKLDSMETKGVPVFTGTDLNGKPFSLESFRNDVVIVNFWASWCAPCLEEVPSLVSLIKAMGGRLKLVAISGDDNREDIEIFLKAFPQMKAEDIVIIWDQDRAISKLYGVDRLPESFVLGKNLKLAKKIMGNIPWHTKDSEAYIGQLLK